MVEHQPSKLDTWVRFPSPAFSIWKNKPDRQYKGMHSDVSPIFIIMAGLQAKQI